MQRDGAIALSPEGANGALHQGLLQPRHVANGAWNATYVANMFATLFQQADLSSQDVEEAASRAVADGSLDAEGVARLLSSMPTEQKHLRRWVKAQYASFLTTAVHTKSRLIKQGLLLPSDKRPKA